MTMPTALPNGFSTDELNRRRTAARRLALVLGAVVLAIYIAGFWFER